jgi:hypothetical protein
MQRYWMFVKYSTEPGSGYSKVELMAQDQFAANAMARAMYGNLLMSNVNYIPEHNYQ